MHGLVYDPEAVGPGASLDPRKIQEAALRFYDRLRDVDRHRDARALPVFTTSDGTCCSDDAEAPHVLSSSVQG